MNLENIRHGEDRNVALRYTRIHENAIHAIGTKLSHSAMKVYLYINFNCNLASGITHRLSYSRIAEYWGITLRSVYREVAELEGARADLHEGVGRLYGGYPAPRLDPEDSRPAELRKEGTTLLSSVTETD